MNAVERRLKGECYDCAFIVRCDEGGLACYHQDPGTGDECPGSREAVKPSTIVRAEEPITEVRSLVARLPAVLRGPALPTSQQEQESSDMALMDQNSTHPAFIGARGIPYDMELRKKAVKKSIQDLWNKNKQWPKKTAIANHLGTRIDMVTKAIDELLDDEDINIEEDGGVSLQKRAKANGAAKASPPPPPPEPAPFTPVAATPVEERVDEVSFENLDAEDPSLKEDALYQTMCEERDGLEASVKALREELTPKEQKLERVRRAIKAYVAAR